MEARVCVKDLEDTTEEVRRPFRTVLSPNERGLGQEHWAGRGGCKLPLTSKSASPVASPPQGERERVSVVTNPRLVSTRIQVRSLALLSRLRIRRCFELWYGSQMQPRSGVAVAMV